MQVSFRGLAIEQARDHVFDTPVPDYWWVIHKGSGRTVISVTALRHRAVEITTELSRLRDWDATNDWEGDEALSRFVTRYPGEVEMPRTSNGEDDWDGDIHSAKRA